MQKITGFEYFAMIGDDMNNYVIKMNYEIKGNHKLDLKEFNKDWKIFFDFQGLTFTH